LWDGDAAVSHAGWKVEGGVWGAVPGGVQVHLVGSQGGVHVYMYK